MSTMTNLFETMNQERAILLDAITTLPEALLDEKGVVGEWSIKNVLAHLTGWERVVTPFRVPLLPVHCSWMNQVEHGRFPPSEPSP